MTGYLIEFQYDHWGQGYDYGVWTTVLVYAESYDIACDIISHNREYEKARNFRNKTLFQ